MCIFANKRDHKDEGIYSQKLIAAGTDDVDRSGYEYDDEDENVGSEVIFSGAVASNNPFAATTDVYVEDLAPAAEFNPFATITDDDQEVFDPFQTIHDDDALNVPFSSEDRDTEDDVMSPSRFQLSCDFLNTSDRRCLGPQERRA